MLMQGQETIQQLKLPGFLIVGAQKAGTTSLFDILNQHSHIYLPPEKELHFFDYKTEVDKGPVHYANYFSEAGEAKAVGEATPLYLFYPEVASLIRSVLGQKIKIIILLRNPAERAFSHYKMMFAEGYEKRPFQLAITDNISRLSIGISFDRITSYLDRSLYTFQLKKYFDLFPKENIRIVLFEEDFVENRKATIAEIQQFLGVDHEELSVHIKSYPTAKPRSKLANRLLNTAHPVNQFVKKLIPSKKLRMLVKYRLNEANSRAVLARDEFESLKPKLIREVFFDDIKETEKLIDRDLGRWLQE
jgi:hypothetical protein